MEKLSWVVCVLVAAWALFCLSRFYSWNQVSSRLWTEISISCDIEKILHAIGMKRKFQLNFYGLLVGLSLVLAVPHIPKLWLVPLSILLIIIGGQIQIKTIDECWKVDVDEF